MVLYASMAMILPDKSSSFTGVFGMRSLKFTPKRTPQIKIRQDSGLRGLRIKIFTGNHKNPKQWLTPKLPAGNRCQFKFYSTLRAFLGIADIRNPNNISGTEVSQLCQKNCH